MSDGERSALYLIGECLSAQENGTIIIDEPEVHLHRSILYPLWKKLEEIRNDCLFVYITHDLEFASSKSESDKFWLKSFDGECWSWEEFPEQEGFPDELLLEIIGSRRDVIFVEGTNGSHDVSLYRIIFPNHFITPRGSCITVINNVKTLQKLPSLHHLNVIGIIDRDRRTDQEIASLENQGIYTLSVAEIENLFCTEGMINLYCEWLSRDCFEDLLKIKEAFFERFERELYYQISLRTTSEIKFKINAFDERSNGIEKLKFNEIISNINIEEIYLCIEKIFNEILEEKNFQKLLAHYNRKDLIKIVEKK